MPIIDRKAKLKARRAIRKQRRQVEQATAAADDSINKHFMRRFNRLFAVRRFVAIWILLVLLLGFGALWQVRGMDRFYLETTPVEGGVYRGYSGHLLTQTLYLLQVLLMLQCLDSFFLDFLR